LAECSFFAKLKILITGVSGFVGQKLAAYLLSEGHSVVGVDLRAVEFDFTEHPDFDFMELDLTDSDSVNQLPWDEVELIYHLAAAGVKVSTREWPLCIGVNVIGTATLFESLLRRVGRSQAVPRVVYSKSYYEDHIDSVAAFRENPYVMSKVAATRWIEALASVYPAAITIAKVFQVYGPEDDPNNVLTYAARKLKAGHRATFGAGAGYRDWIHIDDFIAGLVACGDRRPKGLWRYDLGSGEPHSLRDVVERIAQICGADASLLEFDGSRDRGDGELEDWAKVLVPDFQPKLSLGEGLTALVKGTY